MSDPPPKKIGSLRDRIAAFEKGNSTPGPAPAPAPRPKPGNLSWKPRPPSPSTEPSTTATDDAVVEKKTGGMSASDAKESIGKGGSLKDRMAALQGHGAFGAPAPPPIAPKPAVERPKWKPPPPVASPPQDEEDTPAVVSKSPEIPIRSPPIVAEKVEDEPTDVPVAEPDQEEPADVDAEEEERQRRAALAARMARLGGARVGMGPPVFGKKPTPKSTPASESPAKEIATTDEASVKSPDSADTSAKSPPAEAKATEYFPATAGAQSADSEPPASGKSTDSLVPESSPSIPPRSPNAMPVPAVPRRAAPPRRKAAKSPARPPADEPATVEEPLPDVPPVPKDDDTFSINVDDPPEVKEPIVTRSSQELTDAERRFSMDIASSDMDSTPSVAADPMPVSPQTMEADVTEVGYRRDDTPPPPSPIRDDPAPAKETDDSTEAPLPDAEEAEEDEEAKRKRVAERIAKMGGVNPFAPPVQRKASTDAEVSQPSEPVEAVKEEEEAVYRDVVLPASERKSSIDVESHPTVPQKRSSVSSVQSAEKRKASVDEDILPPIRKDSIEEPKGPVPPSQTDEPESKRKDEEETKTGAEESSDAFREPSDDGEDDEFLDAEDEDDSKIPSISPPITRSLDPPSQHGSEEEDEPPTPPEKASILKPDAEDHVISAASPPPLPASRPPPVPKSTRPPVPPSEEEEEEAPPPPPPRRLSIRKVDDSPEEPPRAISPLSEVAESPVQVSAVPRHLSKVDTDDDEPPASPSPLQVPPPRRFSTDRHDVPLPPPPSQGEDDEEHPRQIPHRALPQTPLAEQDEEVYDESEEEALPTPPPPPRRTTLPPPPPPSAIDPPSPRRDSVSKSDDEPSATPISHEILDDDEGDPIDPGFYSPPRTSNAAPVVSTTEPEAPPVDEEQERRRTIAERMARLGGIKFGAPPVPMTRAHPAPQRRQTQDHVEGDSVSPTTTGEEEAPAELTEEEEERARKERIAAKMATMGGQRIGMMPGFMPPPHRAPPMPKAPPPTQQSYAETDSEHESQDGVKVEAEESEIEEVSHEEAMEEAPPPVPTRAGRRQMSMDSNTSHGTEESTPRIPSGRPPVPTGPPPRRASVQTTRSKRSSTGGESFDTSTRPPTVPQTDFVMVEEPEELPPPPPPSRPPPPRAAVPPPPALDASDNFSASQQWELPSIPTSSLEFSAGGDLSMSWQDDLVESTTTASAPPPPEKRGSHVPSMNPDDVVLTPEDLTAVWGRIGVQVCEVATALYERSKTSLIGDGTYHGFVNAVLSQVPGAASAHPPSYGYTIYTQSGTNVQKRAGDIMPGDIVWLSDAKLKGHKGLQTYSQHVGVGGEALVGVIGEFEPKKFKIRAFQANQHVGQQTVEAASYRLEDLKSGVVKIFRVLEA